MRAIVLDIIRTVVLEVAMPLIRKIPGLIWKGKK